MDDINSLRVDRQPKKEDKDEIRIRGVLENFIINNHLEDVISDLTYYQNRFFYYAFSNLEQRERIQFSYYELLQKLAKITKAKIHEGEEYLEELKSDSFIVVTNHFGIAKLTRMNNHDRRYPVELDEIEPFPSRHSCFVLLSKKRDKRLHEVAIELPEPVLSIQNASGVVTIPPEGTKRTELLTRKINKIKQKNDSIFIMYPEGGTSGKRNKGTPYDLDEFHSGAFFCAANLNLPVLPICQYFNNEGEFELYIFNPIKFDNDTPEVLIEKVKSLRSNMQQKLDLSISS